MAEKSDHFDGQRFYNSYEATSPDETKPNFLTRFLHSLESDTWPEVIANQNYQLLVLPGTSSAIAVTYINHATLLIQINGLNILTDPIWSERASPFSAIGPRRVRSPGIPFDKLPKIDVVLISHNHYDHMDISTLVALNERDHSLFVTGLGNEYILKEHKINNVKVLDWWQSIKVGDTNINFVPAIHSSARGLMDRNKSLWGGFVIQTFNRNIFFAGDTAYGEHFKVIQEKYGAFRLALLPIGHYLPRWMMQSVHMNPEEAVVAHQDLKAVSSIGIHFGIFHGLGSHNQETITEPQDDLKRAKLKHNVSDKDFLTLDVGQGILFQ